MGTQIISLLSSSLGGGGGSLPPKIINVAADFPTVIEANAHIGRIYIIATPVTDNDPTKTNTGQSFLAGEEIVWDGISAYFALGSQAIWIDDGTDVKTVNARHLNLGVNGLKDQFVTTAILLGDASNTSVNTSNKTFVGAINEIVSALPVEQPFSIIASAAQTNFNLPTTPPTPTAVKAFRNGVKAIYGVNFHVIGSTLIWDAPTLLGGEEIGGYYNDTGLSDVVNVTTKTANDTAALEDARHIIEYTNGSSSYSYTLPQNSEVPFPIGTWIEMRKTGTGEITIAKGTGAIFRGILGDVSVKIDGADGYSVFAEKTATNTWLLSGAIKAV